jgi:hypothetical protein
VRPAASDVKKTKWVPGGARLAGPFSKVYKLRHWPPGTDKKTVRAAFFLQRAIIHTRHSTPSLFGDFMAISFC